MNIARLSILNFRNINELDITFNSDFNIFYGLNGQGKTSILEAIYVLSLSKSFRSNSDRLLINHNNKYFDLNGFFYQKTSQQCDIRIFFSPKDGKNIYINSERITKVSKLVGQVPLVFLSLDSLNFINGDPAQRRKMIDILLAQISPVYLQSLQLYKAALNQRNQLLVQINNKNESIQSLFSWNEQLANFGSEIIRMRSQVIDFLNLKVQSYYKHLSNRDDQIDIRYKSTLLSEPSGFEKNSFKELYIQKLNRDISKDIERKSTNSGPHRDDIFIMKNGLPFKDYSSTGENKTFILAYKFAEADYIDFIKLGKPIFLLDDIFGELDIERINYLLEFLGQYGQSFITTTISSKFTSQLLMPQHYYHVKQGVVYQ
jgi:DNA replication and repair protein RecF